MNEIVNWVDRLPEAPTDLILRLRRDLARVIGDCDFVVARRMTAAQAPQLDRSVGLAEAAQRLRMTNAYLSRRANWQKIGGYRDCDRRIKFPLSALEAWVRARGQA